MYAIDQQLECINYYTCPLFIGLHRATYIYEHKAYTSILFNRIIPHQLGVMELSLIWRFLGILRTSIKDIKKLFTTLPLGCPKVCLVKTLPVKTLLDKNLVEEKEYTITIIFPL